MDSKIAIIMGSKSDWPTMKSAVAILNELQISYTVNIYSAHRTPVELAEFVTKINNDDSYKVILAGAGMSAALAGAIASNTIKPVIGIPLSGGKLKGVEALLSTIDMPPGVPVLTVGIDAAKNAALAAASIIALSDSSVAEKICDFRKEQKMKVLQANESIMCGEE